MTAADADSLLVAVTRRAGTRDALAVFPRESSRVRLDGVNFRSFIYIIMLLIRSPPFSFSLFLRCQRASLYTPFSKTLNSTSLPRLGLSAGAAMSSSAGKRSINDVLMGNARAAAAKKGNKGAPSSSAQPKKVKTLEQCFGAKEKSKEEPPIAATSRNENSTEKPKEMAVEKVEDVGREEMDVAEEKNSILEAELKSTVKQKLKSLETGTSSSPKKSKTLAACSKTNNVQEKTSKPCKEEKKAQDQDAEPGPVDEKKASLELKKKGENFDPRKAAFWKPGEPVPFRFLAYALDLISNESGRIAITDILSNVFTTVMATTPGDLLATVYLAANRIAPPHENIELGIGDAALIKALGEAYGRNDDQVKKQLKELGDLGLVAKMSRSSQGRMLSYFGNSQKKKSQNLTISKVLDTFRTIAKVRSPCCSFYWWYPTNWHM